jgi:hypothetical protein
MWEHALLQPDHLGNPLPWLVAALATWRLTHLLHKEVGPWRLLTRIRALTGVRHDSDGTPMAYPDDNVFECFLCLSVWVAALVALLLLVAWWLLVPFAFSGLAIMVNRWYYGKS